MRTGFTQFPNELFTIGLKANEIGVIAWVLSHDKKFKASRYKLHNDLKVDHKSSSKVLNSILKKIEIAQISEEVREVLTFKIKNLMGKNLAGKNLVGKNLVGKNPLNYQVKTQYNTGQKPTKLPGKNLGENIREYKENIKEYKGFNFSLKEEEEMTEEEKYKKDQYQMAIDQLGGLK